MAEILTTDDIAQELRESDQFALRFRAIERLQRVVASHEALRNEREPLMLHNTSGADWPKHPRGLGLLWGGRTLRKALDDLLGIDAARKAEEGL